MVQQNSLGGESGIYGIALWNIRFLCFRSCFAVSRVTGGKLQDFLGKIFHGRGVKDFTSEKNICLSGAGRS